MVSFVCLKWTWTSWGWWPIPHLVGLQMYLNLVPGNEWLYWEVSQNIHCSSVFWNANGWVLQKFKQPCFWETSWCQGMDEKKIIEKWIIVAKWYWYQINKWNSYIGVIIIFFFNWKGKIKCSVNGDIKMSMPRFQNGLENMLQKQSQCCGIKLEKEWQILMETKWS